MDGKIIENRYENPFLPKMVEFLSTAEYLAKIKSDDDKVVIEYSDLDSFDYELASEFIHFPSMLLEATRLALDKKQATQKQIGFRGSEIEINSNETSATYFGKIVKMTVVLNKVDEIKQRTSMAVWRCLRCGNTYNILQEKDKLKEPQACSCRNKTFENVIEESRYVDFRQAKVLGNSNLVVDVEGDLTKQIKKDGKYTITGILQPVIKPKKSVVELLIFYATDIEELVN